MRLLGGAAWAAPDVQKSFIPTAINVINKCLVLDSGFLPFYCSILHRCVSSNLCSIFPWTTSKTNFYCSAMDSIWFWTGHTLVTQLYTLYVSHSESEHLYKDWTRTTRLDQVCALTWLTADSGSAIVSKQVNRFDLLSDRFWSLTGKCRTALIR